MTNSTKIEVIAAYKGTHTPLNGNIAEEVLVLADGRAVYLNPGESDALCATFEDAALMCGSETLTPSETLLKAWEDGYEIE